VAWSPEQISNAKIIIQVGRQLGATDRDITIALMAGWQESGLRNVNYGDRDSVGVFQQRGGWGPRADRLDPVKSARMFFLGGAQGQRGLLDFQNRNSYGLGQAAQKVQVSAHPAGYDKWEDESSELLKELGGSSPHPTVGSLPGLPTADAGGKSDSVTGSPVAPPAPSTALGLGSPETAGTDAAGVAAKGAPGLESADEQPDVQDVPMMDETAFLPLSNGQPGGVAGTFEDMFPNTGPVGGARQRVVDISKSLLGIPYVWGGTDPDRGLDCSGFVQYVYKQMGVNLPRISAAQARAGKRIGLGQLQVGDLVGWDNSSRNNGADHIAIYIGNGQIIEAPRPGLSVRIRELGKSDRGAWGVRLDF
jgi:cell wall-associated NlpC family hydrolase